MIIWRTFLGNYRVEEGVRMGMNGGVSYGLALLGGTEDRTAGAAGRVVGERDGVRGARLTGAAARVVRMTLGVLPRTAACKAGSCAAVPMTTTAANVLIQSVRRVSLEKNTYFMEPSVAQACNRKRPHACGLL